MSSDSTAIRISGLGKCYEIYGAPRDRLKQFLLPRFFRWLGRKAPTYFREFWALRDISFEVGRGQTDPGRVVEMAGHGAGPDREGGEGFQRRHGAGRRRLGRGEAIAGHEGQGRGEQEAA